MDKNLERVSTTAENMYIWLKEGKKVAPSGHHVLNHMEHLCDIASKDLKRGATSSSHWRTVRIKYFYANPQYNRLMGVLEDGRKVDIELGFLDLVWGEYQIYEEPEEPEVRMTMEEIQAELGKRVVLVSNKEDTK